MCSFVDKDNVLLKINANYFVCLFGLMLNVPVNNFSVMLGRNANYQLVCALFRLRIFN